MREPGAVSSDLVAPIGRVVAEAFERVGLQADRVMVVGAWCRDIWHHALGHQFRTEATQRRGRNVHDVASIGMTVTGMPALNSIKSGIAAPQGVLTSADLPVRGVAGGNRATTILI